MRTNKQHGFRIKMHFIAHWVISKLSLFYYYKINSKQITFVRKGGVGDAIASTAALVQFKKENPKSKINLYTTQPEVFNNLGVDKFLTSISLNNFPLVWLSYENYDVEILRNSRIRHIKDIMAEFIGLNKKTKLPMHLQITEEEMQGLFSAYIEDKKYIVIQPHAGHWLKGRDWIDDRWEKLVQFLQLKGYLVYQLGASRDSLINGVIDMRGKLNLSESFYLIKEAKLVMGVNSFAEQAAGVWQVPSVVIYGPTNPQYTLNKNQLAVFGEDKIMDIDQLKNYDYKFSKTDKVSFDLVKKATNKVLGG